MRPSLQLLSTGGIGGLDARVTVRSERADGYRMAAALGTGGRPVGGVDFDVGVEGRADALDAVYAVHLAVAVDTDGPRGPATHVHHVVVSTGRPDPGVGPGWGPGGDADVVVRPLRTHLLGPLDDPVDVVARYAGPHARAGDVVVLGESPLAVMQGRFTDPANGRPGWVASRLAQFMSGEGSVGTGPGLQALVDEVGTPRVLAALTAGAAGKLAGRDGWFYRVAGRQSSLVDDVTGTLAPYDRLIVTGPRRAGEVCRRIRSSTGLGAAVVDANDLGAVDVIAASEGVEHGLIRRALRSNPAGNAAETTPLVLVRRTDGRLRSNE